MSPVERTGKLEIVRPSWLVHRGCVEIVVVRPSQLESVADRRRNRVERGN
jgi:hypothetical protein